MANEACPGLAKDLRNGHLVRLSILSNVETSCAAESNISRGEKCRKSSSGRAARIVPISVRPSFKEGIWDATRFEIKGTMLDEKKWQQMRWEVMDKIIKVVEQAKKEHPNADEGDWLRLWKEILYRANQQVTSYHELMQIRTCLMDVDELVEPAAQPPAKQKKSARKKNG
jgi:hypothetical protein